MKKIVRLTEQDLVRLVNRVINEQSLSDYTSELGKKVKSYGQNLLGKLPPYWGKLKNMNPKPTVETSNLLQKTLGGAAEMLQWINGESVLGVHSDGNVEIIIGPGGGNQIQKKRMNAAESILKSIGLTANWESLHEGEEYVELKKLNLNQTLTLVKNLSKYI